MPKLEWNKDTWDGSYNWQHQGDEWSQAWGGPSMQWHGTILPRIHQYLPTGTILEIAPGYGRWTQFLKDRCQTLLGVDLSEACVEACRQRFAGLSHLTFTVNDGKSLDMVRDNSIDFAFSFDSLVHADDDVLEAYIAQLSRKLTNDGVAFLHHSNFGEYPYLDRIDRLPDRPRRVLARLKFVEPALHFRSPTMTAAKLERFARSHDMQCIAQELVPWGGRSAFSDCLSTVVKRSSSRMRENRVFQNRDFMKEAQYLSRLSRLYGPTARTVTSQS
jgi:SAM-dependent methyltransferase